VAATVLRVLSAGLLVAAVWGLTLLASKAAGSGDSMVGVVS